MDSLNILSSAMQFLWPVLSIATFVVCTQVQGRHKGKKGVSILVAGSALLMVGSLVNAMIRVMMMNGSLDISPVTWLFSLTGLTSFVGQLLFIMGLYQFGTSREVKVDLYDDLLDS
ncbi:hypothetical protein FUA23_14855 [Neolewinella aurantiaca]|uniref:Uncharacterized protein n=1 Tax=Neolewinella aurantiaca TaxID=2602767 RepID=A0A5C7FCL9_9BACT|nr:hypothetical protein [Neolewinella aurantiaca]TXF88414.1 hypothetical protein FUA23_14855 [Neolewinella aurantiaca]